jgi:predicted nucleotidyltransferase component of viral defense system
MRSLTDTQKETLGLVSGSSLVRGFYLAGGTAIAIKYNHRFSEDFDFFTYPDFKFDPFSLQEKIDKALHEVDWRIFDNSTVIFVLRGIKFSFFEYGYPLVKPTTREEGLGIDIASDEDISAMKLLAIAKRGVKKDFYDLWFLMKKRGWDLKDVIGFAKFKYPNINTGIYLRSIVYFKDAEKETAQKEVEMAWEQIKEFFEFQCKSLLKDINLP